MLDEGNPEPLSCGPPKGLDTPEPFGRAVPTGEILAQIPLPGNLTEGADIVPAPVNPHLQSQLRATPPN